LKVLGLGIEVEGLGLLPKAPRTVNTSVGCWLHELRLSADARERGEREIEEGGWRERERKVGEGEWGDP